MYRWGETMKFCSIVTTAWSVKTLTSIMKSGFLQTDVS